MTPPPYGLYLDLQATQHPASSGRGIGRYVAEHALALLTHTDLVRGMALHPQLPFPGRLPSDLLRDPKLIWNTATTLHHARHCGPIAYHLMSPLFPLDSPHQHDFFFPQFARDPDIPLVVTLYDLIVLDSSDDYLSEQGQRAAFAERLQVVRDAALVLTVSQFTRQEAIRLLDLDPDRVVCIGAGVSPLFRPAPAGSQVQQQLRRQLPTLIKPFVMCVSGMDDRKNTEALLSAYAQLNPELRSAHQLVIVCALSAAYEERWRQHARSVGLAPNELVLTNSVPDSLLRDLYQAARVTVAPSLHEGFGLTIAEAIACGAPAICANTTASPEILDWAPATFVPSSPVAIANAMTRALTDREFRQDLRQAALKRAPLYTWDKVAQRTALALERLPQPTRRSGNPSRRRPRLALVGPLPPERSGIADYNARLLPELARRCELDVFSSHSAPGSSPAANRDFRLFPASALGEMCNPSAYDAIIYTVGNSEHHQATYQLARRFPGIVWLHDIRFRGFFLTRHPTRHAEKRQNRIGAKLRRHYGSRVPLAALQRFSAEDETRFGLRLTAGWVRNARLVLTNSQFAARLILLDQGPDARLSPIITLPFAVTSLHNVQHIARDEPPLIASFGAVSHGKFPLALIAALARARAVVPARLVFVGSVKEKLRRELEAYAADLGLADHVELTGFLAPEEYQRWLWRASCAAQLRTTSSGEMSAALNDCLAAGLPVVTNMAEVAAEYAPGSIITLDPSFAIEDLAIQIIRLLTDTDAWAYHHAACLRHAARMTFAHLVDELIAAVDSLAGESAPPPWPYRQRVEAESHEAIALRREAQ